jgi:hypothetical protein
MADDRRTPSIPRPPAAAEHAPGPVALLAIEFVLNGEQIRIGIRVTADDIAEFDRNPVAFIGRRFRSAPCTEGLHPELTNWLGQAVMAGSAGIQLVRGRGDA